MKARCLGWGGEALCCCSPHEEARRRGWGMRGLVWACGECGKRTDTGLKAWKRHFGSLPSGWDLVLSALLCPCVTDEGSSRGKELSSSVVSWEQQCEPVVGNSLCGRFLIETTLEGSCNLPRFQGLFLSGFFSTRSSKGKQNWTLFYSAELPGQGNCPGLDLSWTSFKHIFLSMETFPLRPYDPSSGVFVTHTK